MIAKSSPFSVEAVQRLHEAMAAHQRGELVQAETAYRELVKSFPGFAEVWHYYGLLCHERGDNEQSRKLLRRAQSLAPGNVVFLVDFGRVLREQGEYTQAVGRFERALRLVPDYEEALIGYALTLVESGQGAGIVTRLEQQIRTHPDDWRLWALLGKCREQLNDTAGAQSALSEAVQRAPGGAASDHLRLAKNALSANDVLTSELEFRAALQILPSSGNAYLRLANMAMEAGDFVRGQEWAREALKCNSRLWKAWALLATNPEDEAFIDRLETAARDGERDTAVSAAYFALGWLRERRGEYDEAFAAYERANFIQGRHRYYDPRLQEAYVDNLIESLDDTFMRRAAAIGVRSRRAIFICGMPRSGTTLVEAILASHPEVSAGGEMTYVHDWLSRSMGVSDRSRTGAWLRGAGDSQLHALAQEWEKYLERAAGGAARITDKMPGNYHLLGLIAACFPDAAIVHVTRDPRDTGLSCFATYFEKGHYFSHALESIGHYYRLHTRLMEHWRKTRGFEGLIEIEYEALVAQPENEIRRLLDALQLPWNSACLRFHEHHRNVHTASLTQVRRPMYSSSIGRWRNFERHIAPLLKSLGFVAQP